LKIKIGQRKSKLIRRTYGLRRSIWCTFFARIVHHPIAVIVDAVTDLWDRQDKLCAGSVGFENAGLGATPAGRIGDGQVVWVTRVTWFFWRLTEAIFIDALIAIIIDIVTLLEFISITVWFTGASLTGHHSHLIHDRSAEACIKASIASRWRQGWTIWVHLLIEWG